MPARVERVPAPISAPSSLIRLSLFGALVLTAPLDAVRAGAYIALDGTSVTLGDAFEPDLNPRGGRLRLGLRVSEAFDVEVQAGFSRDAERRSFGAVEASWAGAYLKGYLPVGRRSALYALGGFATVELAQRIGDVDIVDDRGGFSFGAGLETQLTGRLDLTADWMRYVGEDSGTFERVDAASLGLKLYF